MKRTHIDLFSGIGGFALAARWAGVQTIGFAEIDDYASRVLAKNFPGVTNYGDVRNVPGDISAWLITGGFPCQPFSVAGKQRGAADDRWLWPEMLGAIERIRPTWVLGENVPGIIRMELDTVLSDLERIGYAVQTFVIPAVGIDAPHRRERVWIVGNAERSEFSGVNRRRAGAQPTGRREDLADADEGDSGRRSIQPQRKAQGRTAADGNGEALADAEKLTIRPGLRTDEPGRERRGRSGDSSQSGDVADSERQGLAFGNRSPGERTQPAVAGGCRWATEPDVGERIDGIPARLDGIGGLNGQATENGTETLLPALRAPTDPQILSGQTGRYGRIQSTQILQSGVHGSGVCQRHAILFGLVETGDTVPWELLRSVWGYSHGEFASHRRQSGEQLTREYPDLMRQLSHFASPPCSACWSDGSWEGDLPRVAHGIPNRVDRLRGLGNAIVPQVAYQLIRMMIEAEESL